MYPAAGIIIWLVIGGIVGWLGTKISGTTSAVEHGANMGISLLASVAAGFITTAMYNGERSSNGLVMSVVAAALAACVVVALFRVLFPRRSPRFND